ncbi:Replication factor C subunit 5 [Galdieria sulphuraria]|nr:Replication factor C subunit 5 [Galdieria sulphuraria]
MANDDANLMWLEKYRPKTFNDVLSQQDIIVTILRFVNSNSLPHMLFYGPPGTGKTSTILACAEHMYGTNFKSMVLELNASDDRGIDVVRNEIKDFCSTQRIFATGVKLVILDEADAMTSAAQMALRRIMEKYTSSTRFCLICNYANKIIPALQSRCTRFRFGPLKEEDIRLRLGQIAEREGVVFEKDALETIIQLSQGDMRSCINILQSTFLSSGKVTCSTVYENTGNPSNEEMEQIMDWLNEEDDFSSCYDKVKKMKAERGFALIDILRQIHKRLLTRNMSRRAKAYLLEKLADIEHQLAFGGSELLNLCSLIGSFQIMKTLEVLDAAP